MNKKTVIEIGPTIGTIGAANCVQKRDHKIDLTDDHRSWNNRIWDKKWIQNKMTEFNNRV